MNKRSPKNLTVLHKKYISANMLEITLHGDELGNDINWRPGCYVKLLLPSNSLLGRPKMRTYTARNHDATAKTLTIEFAIHHPAGIATTWALDAKEGDKITVMGPGQLKMDSSRGDWYVFAADMSALPAALSIMESLDPETTGYAILEISDEKDKQNISIPENIEVQWLIHPDPSVKSNQQLNALKDIPSTEGIANIFVAGELSTIREIKSYITNEPRYKDAQLYISSYWKIGLKSEGHKMAKKSLMFA